MSNTDHPRVSPCPQVIVVPRPVKNLVTDYTQRSVKMSVSVMSSVDIKLSEVHNLLVEVNEELSRSPDVSRSHVLSRVQYILSEMQWTVSLSSDENSDSGSCYSGDVESLSWDSSGDIYKLYYDEDEEDYDEDGEGNFEIDDHGPIEVSIDSSAESSPHEDEEESKSEDFSFNGSRSVVKVVRKVPASPGWVAPKLIPAFETDSSNEDSDHECETVPDATATTEDDGVRFVDEMLAKINSLAPNGVFKVSRVRKPLKYTIDLTKVNQFFLRNIPKPEYYPILGCSNDPEFYNGKFYKDGREYSKFKENVMYFESNFPFGGLFGYKTDVGIIPVPKQAVFGHVWTGKVGEGWVLQAQVDDGVPAGGPWSPPPRTRGERPSG